MPVYQGGEIIPFAMFGLHAIKHHLDRTQDLPPVNNNGSASLLPDGVRDAEPKEASV